MRVLAVRVALAATLMSTSLPAAGGIHPFDPLNAAEVAAAAAAVRGDSRLPAEAWLVSVDLAEPSKAAMLAGAPVPRRAVVVVLDVVGNRTFEVIANLDRAVIDSWRVL